MAREHVGFAVVDYAERAAERDRALAKRLRQNADDLRMYIREWIQTELKDDRVELQILEVTLEGALQAAVTERLARIDDIDRRELRDIENLFEERLRAVDVEEEADPSWAADYLQEGIARYDAIVRELQQVREFLLDFTGSASGEAGAS